MDELKEHVEAPFAAAVEVGRDGRDREREVGPRARFGPCGLGGIRFGERLGSGKGAGATWYESNSCILQR